MDAPPSRIRSPKFAFAGRPQPFKHIIRAGGCLSLPPSAPAPAPARLFHHAAPVPPGRHCTTLRLRSLRGVSYQRRVALQSRSTAAQYPHRGRLRRGAYGTTGRDGSLSVRRGAALISCRAAGLRSAAQITSPASVLHIMFSGDEQPGSAGEAVGQIHCRVAASRAAAATVTSAPVSL